MSSQNNISQLMLYFESEDVGFRYVRSAEMFCCYFPQTVDGGIGELHGESSQSPVCHLLEE